MYPIDVHGDGVVAHVMAHLCQRSGFNDLSLTPYPEGAIVTAPPALTLGANQSRILYALGLGESLEEAAWQPDREQVRLARSQYLVSELPLGKFYRDRYGAPMLNLTYTELLETVRREWPDTTSSAVSLTIETEQTFGNTDRQDGTDERAADWQLLHNLKPSTHAIANVTWLASNGIAWQFSSRCHDHLYVLCQPESQLKEEDWNPALWDQIQAADTFQPLDLSPSVREHWVEGDYVHIGHAAMPCHPIRRETWLTGLEDAWVLSRMLENYEEAMAEGLLAYQKYRKPRAQRILRSNESLSASQLAATPSGRLMRNLGIGLRSRFLPEVAMQRIDWLYGFDCIKGFN